MTLISAMAKLREHGCDPLSVPGVYEQQIVVIAGMADLLRGWPIRQRTRNANWGRASDEEADTKRRKRKRCRATGSWFLSFCHNNTPATAAKVLLIAPWIPICSD
jgi:hypothetical protein